MAESKANGNSIPIKGIEQEKAPLGKPGLGKEPYSDLTESEESRESEKSDQKLEKDEKSLEELLADKEKEAQENFDKRLRLLAEFENYKKRQDREKAEFYKMATESLIRDLLPVVDTLERALDHSQENNVPDSFIEGIELVRENFLSVLEKQGLKPIEAVGKTFDPNFHEAVMQKDDLESEENTVLNEAQKGYMLHDKLLRPTMVIVSKNQRRLTKCYYHKA